MTAHRAITHLGHWLSHARYRCPAKIRPFPNPTEVQCDHGREPHEVHGGTLRDYAYPGSQTEMTWRDDDRRNFTGPWVPCSKGNCTLPNGHHGRCAP